MAKRQLYRHRLTDIFEGTTYYDYFAMEKDGDKVEIVKAIGGG